MTMTMARQQQEPQDYYRFQGKRNEICRFFAAGNCAKGAECLFAHVSCNLDGFAFEANPQEGASRRDRDCIVHLADALQQSTPDLKGCDADRLHDGVANGAKQTGVAMETLQPPASESPEKPMLRQNSSNCECCGTLLKPIFRFCTECGHKVGDSLKSDDVVVSPTAFPNGLSYTPCTPPAQVQPLYMSALQFFPSSPSSHGAKSPVNDVLYGLLEDMAPGVVNEMKKSTKLCESLLLQAMPDHYDD
mmetsp:Transcript_70405/g.132876  ORF Transcript_70405/g.132876 Transcript_70405/m.132876 type:complete len:247 (+) Transcript_70405:60-800(+)